MRSTPEYALSNSMNPPLFELKINHGKSLFERLFMASNQLLCDIRWICSIFMKHAFQLLSCFHSSFWSSVRSSHQRAVYKWVWENERSSNVKFTLELEGCWDPNGEQE